MTLALVREWQMFAQCLLKKYETYFTSLKSGVKIFTRVRLPSLTERSLRACIALQCACTWLPVHADVLICKKLENCRDLAQLPLMMSLSYLMGGSIILHALLTTPNAHDIYPHNPILTRTSRTHMNILTHMRANSIPSWIPVDLFYRPITNHSGFI